MFGSNKIKSSKIDTLISAGVEVTGDVNFTGGLHLEGVISGNVSTSDTSEGTILVVSEGGRVDGNVHVAYAVINGEVNGNVYASVKLDLSNKARISGDVEYDLLAMASGASINGKMLRSEQPRKVVEQKPVEQKSVVPQDIKNQASNLKETVTA